MRQVNFHKEIFCTCDNIIILHGSLVLFKSHKGKQKKKLEQKYKNIICVTIISVSLRAQGNSDRKNIKCFNLCKSVFMQNYQSVQMCTFVGFLITTLYTTYTYLSIKKYK